MKILYAGTPEIAVPSLEALAAVDGIDVVGVLTAPDKTSGRGRKLTAPPVKSAAEKLGIPVIQPPTLGADGRKETEALGADLLVVFAYGRIFGPKFLALFPEGAINMHPSPLPKYRGPAPLTAAILAGDDATALTVQRVSLEMDAGDIISQAGYPLEGTETTGTLTDAVAAAAAPELVSAVISIAEGTAASRPQDHNAASYCSLVTRDDGIISWNEAARSIERKVRAYSPWPKTRTLLGGETLVVLEASVAEIPAGGGNHAVPGTVLGVDKSGGILIQTGEGVLGITRLQLASRKPLDFRSFLNGVALETGTILGDKNGI